jgi:predicted RNase H-like nuclease (RuvC/YqgF family)
MRKTIYVIIAMLAFAGCANNNEQVQKITETISKDSALLVNAGQKDSEISSYLGELKVIGENLDKIKNREKIITISAEGKEGTNRDSLIAEVKELDDWIVMNDKKMNRLQARLKKMTAKNENLESIVSHLTQEITEKDEEISDLQLKLSSANQTIMTITTQFNDSIKVIKQERTEVTTVKTEINTVYYVTGTMKELQDKGIVTKEGGFIGIGRVAVVNSEIDNSKFTKADLPNLKTIVLNGKFRRIITTHPDNSYNIIPGAKTDSLSITNPATFWGESKYLVIAIK